MAMGGRCYQDLVMPMSKDVRGKKRHCKSCGAKFYDLGREPVVCVVCGASFAEEKSAKPPEPEVEEVKVEAEPEEVPETKSKTSVVEPELISLDEAEAAEASDDDIPDLDDEEAIVDLDDEEEDAKLPDDDEDTFLEEEDDEEPDVEGIIGSPIQSDDQGS